MPLELSCNLPEEIDEEYLIATLPQTRGKILEVKCVDNLIHVKLFTSCNTIDDVKQWIQDFEEVSQTSYSITVTKSVTARYVEFKQYLHCRHKTQSKSVYDASRTNNSTRNTNCPSTLKITLHAKKKRYQSKDKARNELLQEMRCEIDIILTHNHDVGSATALSFRKVSSAVREKLIDLYCKGHSPATALQAIRMDIYRNFENYDQVLVDRKHCPDYNYCYNVYIKQFKEQYGHLEFDHGSDTEIQIYTQDNIQIEEIVIKTEMPDPKKLMEQTKERVEVILEEFNAICGHYLEKSPNKVKSALESMLENMRKIRTVPAFISACRRFGLDYRRRNRLNMIPVQQIAINRRRPVISRRKSNVGGRPRKLKVAVPTECKNIRKLVESDLVLIN